MKQDIVNDEDHSPIRIADGIWWVGARLNSRFQCHAYLIENGDESVLIDPGSFLTINTTLEKVQQVVPLDSIKYLLCHHSDPDIASALYVLSRILTRDDIQVVTEWRAAELMEHYDYRFTNYLVEEHGWKLPLSNGRTLEFQLTPYLHFPGAFVTYDPLTQTLFSSDLFGGFVPDKDVLVSDDINYILNAAKPFHQHYMPSTELLDAGLSRIQKRWDDIQRIAPQHGHVIEQPLVEAAFDGLRRIDCGVFTLADADLDLRRLLRLSEARGRLTRALLTTHGILHLIRACNQILLEGNLAGELAIQSRNEDGSCTRWTTGSESSVDEGDTNGWIPVVMPGEPEMSLLIRPTGEQTLDPDLVLMLNDMAPIIRPALDTHLSERRLAELATHLQEEVRTDPLTGLGNRRGLEATATEGSYCLIALDLDNFKLVNDTYGHPAGDAVLTTVSSALRECVRSMDVVFRVGGEEFLVYLPNTTVGTAVNVAERTLAAVRDIDFTGMAPDGRLTMSAGVAAHTPGDETGLAEVIKKADQALYLSKRTGRNRVSTY